MEAAAGNHLTATRRTPWPRRLTGPTVAATCVSLSTKSAFKRRLAAPPQRALNPHAS
jgi:hypothetical protein